MDRRTLLKMTGLLAGGALLGGGTVIALTRDDDRLADHRQATAQVFAGHYGAGPVDTLQVAIQATYEELTDRAPYIGGEANPFTEWLDYGAYYLAVYRVLQANEVPLDVSGRLVYEIFEAQAAYPAWLMRTIGRMKYGPGYIKRLKPAVAATQERRYPGDWVAAWVEGDGENFDFGLDITECGICKLYAQEGAPELAPYLCLSDEVGSRAMGRGLVRHTTVAEGGDVCDFRFKWGRETYVAPLRDGWPPKFAGS